MRMWLKAALLGLVPGLAALPALLAAASAHAQPVVSDPLAAQELARAETLIELGEYDEAVAILKRLANGGFVLAAVRLADLLYDEIEVGTEVADSPEQRAILDLAIDFYRQATAIDGSHYDRAGRRLARLLLLRAESDTDVQAAVDQLRSLIVLGSGAAAYDLGRAYMFGRGVPGNARQAERYLHIAIDMGEYNAARLFGFILARGIGRPSDPEAAIRYLQMAVDHDDYRAARTMADVYARMLGDGESAVAAVDAEIDILQRLFRADPRPGYAMRLSELYLRDPYRPQELDQGMAWLDRAAADGTGLAAYRLFQIYVDPAFGPYDPVAAGGFAGQVAADAYWDAVPAIANQYFLAACDAPADAAQALDWLEQAAAAGHADSMHVLGRALAGDWACLSGGRRESQQWMLAAAEAGWGENEDVLDLGRAALDTALDEADREHGLALLAVAAARGNLAAKTDLGAILLEEGTSRAEIVRGADLLRAVGNEQNGPRAMIALARGLLYSADADERAEALLWLKRAVGYGRPDAMRILGRAYMEGLVAPHDPAAATELLAHALALGDGEAGVLLADIYMSGLNGTVDLDRARTTLEQAAGYGSAEAMLRLSEIYRLGLGVDAQPALADDFLLRAAEAGNTQAQLLREAGVPALPGIGAQPSG
ncbi:MAG: tetratricopeptide repeat protein [Alphaproteobacteria bacterium]